MEKEKCVYCREYGNLPCEKCDKKDKEKVFLDLSKLSEEQQKVVISLVKHNMEKTAVILDILLFNEYENLWCTFNRYIGDKTELTYPDFIKLFEGGEVEKTIQPPLLSHHWMDRNNNPNMTEPLVNALQQIKKLKADKAELLEALEVAKDFIYCPTTHENMKSLIQKHKQ